MDDFDKIYTKYLKDIYHFLLKLSGNHHVAEELTQTTFAIAFENLDKFRGTCKLSVWLCQIAKHEYYAYCKKNNRFVTEDEAFHVASDVNPEEKIIRQFEQYRIHEIIHELPEPYKEVFTLRTMAELSYRDISSLFGKTESWARVTYYRAKSMIIKELGGENDAEM